MKNITVAFIVGVCVTLTVLSVWMMLSMNSRIARLESFAVQVTSLINSNSQKQTQ